MQYALTEDQTMLAKTASAFFKESSPLSRLRKLRNSNDPLAYSKELYSKMAELGWTSIPFEERDGGLGMGLSGTILVTEAMGRHLAGEPLLSSILLAGHVLASAGSPAQREAWLAPAIAGEKVLAFAHTEAKGRFSRSHVETRATGGFVLNGEKHSVIGGAGADAFVVSARTSGDPNQAEGISLFLVPANAKGLTVTRQHRIDSHNAALVTLKDVAVPADALIGEKDRAFALIESTTDRATIGLCGEMVGAMSEAFERTLDYLKERKQFGVAIGTFQALKHRAAKLFIEIELAKSATMSAARALDEGSAEAPALVSLAKARCSDTYVLTANEAVQLHGGIGMTDEHDIGFFIKHARVCELTFGDSAYHRDRFARLHGY